MSKLILDDALQAKLAGAEDKVEFCDKNGQTLGFYLTREAYQHMLYELAKTQVSDEELEEARREKGGLTTAELLAHLKKIEDARGQ